MCYNWNMSQIIPVASGKGGVGKTTSAINIGAYIALAGKKVLLVDFDSQGNMSSGVGISKDKPTVYELLAGQVEAKDAVKHTALENLDEIVEHFIALVEEEKVNAAVDHIHDLQAREVFVHG